MKIDGKWVGKPTEYRVEDLNSKRNAKRWAERYQAKVDAAGRRDEGGTPTGPLTVRRYVKSRLDKRREEGHDWTADRGRLEKHVLPTIGDLVLADVRTVHIADLVRKLRFASDPKLAPRTVRNIYSVVNAMFRDAAIDGDIEVNPCILTDAQLGNVVDKDPEWREGAVFTRDEAEILISHPEIPADRQLVYAFGLLAGMRPDEVGALRWRHYDPAVKPLGSLLVAQSYNTKRNATKGTKTETVKRIPVHPTLAAMLAEWRRSGWARMMGHAPETEPEPDDLIVPLPPDTTARRTSRKGTEPHRGYDYSGKRWREVDLPMLGWRERTLYDTKSTFVTLAIDDGADRDIIRDRVTHTKQKRSAFDGYDRGAHREATCREVAKLRISRRRHVTARVTVGDFSSRNWAPEEGFEPPTRRLTAACSTTELLRNEGINR